jgi:hypothetical protein
MAQSHTCRPANRAIVLIVYKKDDIQDNDFICYQIHNSLSGCGGDAV